MKMALITGTHVFLLFAPFSVVSMKYSKIGIMRKKCHYNLLPEQPYSVHLS